ncbi:hypothetical protein INS49_005370 [Diaporthe citri]|uniref:uncharacterized protein n=1 Tax=Diaporthe citri TaxID=83186 RepID=UPI001C8017D3|nr:uncharacterized protein INS49_005370 [Diaporthe citri]KAG6353662.1 hypothetical protein INS49_005370 [Diaporthe citri]
MGNSEPTVPNGEETSSKALGFPPVPACSLHVNGTGASYLDSDVDGDEADGDGATDVAICGFSFKFPQDATSGEGLWNMMAEKRCAMSEFPRDRVNTDGFYQKTNRINTMPMRGGHFIRGDLAEFDADFFSISPAEAAAMDPMQRWLLEAAYRALENAGMPLQAVAGSSTAVYTGSFNLDNTVHNSRDSEDSPVYNSVGSGLSMLANRLSWFFDLRGPSIGLDSACSSTAMAIDIACQALKSGACDMALVAGSNLSSAPEPYVWMSNLNFLSPDSKCYSFDKRANGYARGEGIAVIVLKRVEDAVRDGNRVRAVIRATGSNEDGRTPGITQPSSRAQEQLIRNTYQKARLSMAHTRFFEAHGTGTPIGDPREALAIGRAFRHHRTGDDPLYVGALKSNIGHLEGASGLAGVIKAVLVLEKGLIPPNANFEKLNSKIDAEFLRLSFPESVRPWPTPGLRRASVNSFGYGGSNSHIILDDAYNYLRIRSLPGKHCSSFSPPQIDPNSSGPSEDGPGTLETVGSDPKLLVWSAADKDGIARSLKSYREWYESVGRMRTTNDPTQLANLAFTLGSHQELLKPKQTSKVNEAEFSQPLCTILQMAVVNLLRRFGIVPSAVVGHSSGEIAAAYAGGYLSSESAWKLAYFRGLCSAELSAASMSCPVQGAMMAVGLSEEATAKSIATVEAKATSFGINIACINSPDNVTVSGEERLVDQLKTQLEAQNVFARKLRVSLAYHSRQMRAISIKYTSLVEALTGPPDDTRGSIPMISTVSGERVDAKRLLGMLVMALEAVKQLTSAMGTIEGYTLRDVHIEAPMDLTNNSNLEAETSLRQTTKSTDGQTFEFTIRSIATDEWLVNCRGYVSVQFARKTANWEDRLSQSRRQSMSKDIVQLSSSFETAVDSQRMYGLLQKYGFDYGSDFRAATHQRCDSNENRAAAQVALFRSANEPHIIHPVSLDAILHIFLTALTSGGSKSTNLNVPYRIGSLWLSNRNLSWPESETVEAFTAITRITNRGCICEGAALDTGDPAELRLWYRDFEMRTVAKDPHVFHLPNPEQFCMNMSFSTLDVNGDLEKQGFGIGAYDVVVADNVLHVSYDVAETIRQVRHVLKPGGKLIIHEASKPDGWPYGFVFGLFPGWWQGSGSNSRLSPSLHKDQWDAVLRENGFSGVDHAFRDFENDTAHHSGWMISTAAAGQRSIPHTQGQQITWEALVFIKPESTEQTYLAETLLSRLQDLFQIQPRILSIDSVNEATARTEHDSLVVLLTDYGPSWLNSVNERDWTRLKQLVGNSRRFLWVTAGGGCNASPEHAVLDGLARTLRSEDSRLHLVTVALEPYNTNAQSVKHLSQIIKTMVTRPAGQAYEQDFIEIDTKLHTRRLVDAEYLRSDVYERLVEYDTVDVRSREDLAFEVSTVDSSEQDGGTPFYVECPRLSDEDREPDTVDIEVKAVSLLSRDRDSALELVASAKYGSYCAGTVVRGPEVDSEDLAGVRPGDRVFAACLGSFRSHESVFQKLQLSEWKATINSKVQASWNLHCELPRDLDFFIMTSSITGILGRASLAAYNAGNTYQDSLARHRVSKGERAASLNLGAVPDAGYLNEHAGGRMKDSRDDLYVLNPLREVCALLDVFCDPKTPSSLDASGCHAAIGIRPPSRWKDVGKVPITMEQPYWGHMHYLPVLNSSDATMEHADGHQVRVDPAVRVAHASSLADAADIVSDALARQVAIQLNTAQDRLDPQRPMYSFGIDSLSAVEIRNWVDEVFSADLPTFDILGGVTFANAALNIAQQVQLN